MMNILKNKNYNKGKFGIRWGILRVNLELDEVYWEIKNNLKLLLKLIEK